MDGPLKIGRVAVQPVERAQVVGQAGQAETALLGGMREQQSPLLETDRFDEQARLTPTRARPLQDACDGTNSWKPMACVRRVPIIFRAMAVAVSKAPASFVWS